MSIITLTFTDVTIPDPAENGSVTFDLSFGLSSSPTVVSISEIFSVNNWNQNYVTQLAFDGNVLDGETTALQFANAINRDWKNAGGSFNISATADGNNCTINAVEGIFSSHVYTGNMVGISEVIYNDAIIDPLKLFVSISETEGDCNIVDCDITATGGVHPYSLVYASGFLINSSWDGSNIEFQVRRGQLDSFTISDSLGFQYELVVNAPRNIVSGYFTPVFTEYPDSTDVLINQTTIIEGTQPLQYSITDDPQFKNYKESNVFTGMLPGEYTLFVKDVYGCEVSKIVVIEEYSGGLSTENPRYFEIPEGQSVVFSEFPKFDANNKKNYFNTGSYNELGEVITKANTLFDEKDVVGFQFKSSYDYHNITVHDCETGNKIDIPSILIQQNRGVGEKIDCNSTPIGGKTAIYFNGGNRYNYDTLDVIGPSEYDGTTPTWAVVGQYCQIGLIGGHVITGTGFDSVLGGYFLIDAFTSVDLGGIRVQAIYNAQEYNLFESYFNAFLMPKKFNIIVEKGFNGNLAEGNPFVSENITVTEDEDNVILLEWSDSKNKGGIVFQSGITYKARFFGEFNPRWEDDAEIEKGDDRTYSISQSSYVGFDILIEAISPKQVTQLNIASGLEGFSCNNIRLVRSKSPEIKRIGKTNLYSWSCEFDYGENNLAVNQDEIVLSVGTGVVGGGGTGENPIPDLSEIQLLEDENDNLLKFNENILKT